MIYKMVHLLMNDSRILNYIEIDQIRVNRLLKKSCTHLYTYHMV